MSITARLRESRAVKTSTQHPRDPVLAKMLGIGNESESGIVVTEETALKFSAVFASVRVISETKASLPIKVFERLPGGRRAEVTMHPVNDIVHFEPNADQTPMVWSEVRQAHLLTWGNSYAEIIFDRRGVVIEVIPLNPWDVRPFRGSSGQLLYEVREQNGGSRILDRSQVLHVPGLGNGIVGWSPIRMAAESIGIGLANERFAAKFFANSARPSMVLEHPDVIGDDAYARLQRDVESKATGENAHKPMIFEEGMKAHLMTMPLNEAQFLESREYTEEVIVSRWYRLPPHVAGLLRRATFSNIEQQDLYFEKHTMRPWIRRDEEELNRKLFTREERQRFYVKVIVADLLRTDIKTRFEAYKTALNNGWMNVDEVRDREDMNPLPDDLGQVYMVPVNMQSIDNLDADADPPEPPPAAPPPTDDGDTESARMDAIQRQNQALVCDLVRSLVGIEQRRAITAARKPARFLQWLDEFYNGHRDLLQTRLSVVCEDAADVASQHVQESRAALLAASDTVVLSRASADEFEGTVRACVEGWESRADALTARILEVTTCS